MLAGVKKKSPGKPGAAGGAANKTQTAGENNWTMNALTRWDPFHEMDDLQKRLTSIFGLAPQRPANGKEETMTVAQWLPLVDITEDDREYLIKAELQPASFSQMRPAFAGRFNVRFLFNMKGASPGTVNNPCKNRGFGASLPPCCAVRCVTR